MNKRDDEFSLDDDFSLPDEPIDEPVLPDIDDSSDSEEFSLDDSLDLELPEQEPIRGDSLDDIVAGFDYSNYDEEEYENNNSGSKISNAIGGNSSVNVNNDEDYYDDEDDSDDEDDDSDYPFDSPEFSDEEDEV